MELTANQQNWADDITEEIVYLIQKANNEYVETISTHESNEVILSILRKFKLEDDADMLIDCLGVKNYEKIREAEQGYY
jgi:hypothetical protein